MHLDNTFSWSSNENLSVRSKENSSFQTSLTFQFMKLFQIAQFCFVFLKKKKIEAETTSSK